MSTNTVPGISPHRNEGGIDEDSKVGYHMVEENQNIYNE